MALRISMLRFFARRLNVSSLQFIKTFILQKSIWKSQPRLSQRQIRLHHVSPSVHWSAVSLACAATSYALYRKEHDSTHVHLQQHESNAPRILTRLPNIMASERIECPHDRTDLELVLFQYQSCPACSKVRVFLDYMGLSYSLVKVEALPRLLLQWSSDKNVPLMLLRQRKSSGNYVQICDSSTIISLLSAYLLWPNEADVMELAQHYPSISSNVHVDKQRHDTSNNAPEHRVTLLANSPNEHKWREWVDNHLVHLISPNCYRSMTEAFETFKWFSLDGDWERHFPAFKQKLMVYAGAIIMWFAAKILKKRHNLTDDVRLHMYQALEEWHARALRGGHKQFSGGERPNNADLAVYGVLSSVEGSALFRDCLMNTQIGDWYYRMQSLVRQHGGVYQLKHRKEQLQKLKSEQNVETIN